MPSAETRLAAVIGSPVRHSLSPAIHQAAFDAEGLDWVFLAFEVEPGHVAGALDGVRSLGIGGLSVTMPHKQSAAALVDELTPTAQLLGAVNCIVAEGEHLVGHNTDGQGFVEGLRAEAGIELAHKRVAVLGAGGAAAAVIVAADREAARDIVVVNRTPERAEAVCRLAPGTARVGADVADADVVVNATPLGMGGDPSLPIDPQVLSSDQVVVDLVYEPLETPLLAACRERDVTAFNGVAMLVHQAAAAWLRWTGREAPVDAMSAGALAEIASRAANR